MGAPSTSRNASNVMAWWTNAGRPGHSAAAGGGRPPPPDPPRIPGAPRPAWAPRHRRRRPPPPLAHPLTVRALPRQTQWRRRPCGGVGRRRGSGREAARTSPPRIISISRWTLRWKKRPVAAGGVRPRRRGRRPRGALGFSSSTSGSRSLVSSIACNACAQRASRDTAPAATDARNIAALCRSTNLPDHHPQPQGARAGRGWRGGAPASAPPPPPGPRPPARPPRARRPPPPPCAPPPPKSPSRSG